MKVITSTLVLSAIAFGSVGIANAIPSNKIPFSALRKGQNEARVTVPDAPRVAQRPVTVDLKKSTKKADRPTYLNGRSFIGPIDFSAPLRHKKTSSCRRR